MQAGRELDALIAEKVMGWTDVTKTPTMANGLDGMGLPPHDGPPKNRMFSSFPAYSTDIAAAFEVVEKVSADYKWDFNCIYREPNDGKWAFGTYDRDGSFYPRNEAGTAPLAICLSALEAVGFNPAP